MVVFISQYYTYLHLQLWGSFPLTTQELWERSISQQVLYYLLLDDPPFGLYAVTSYIKYVSSVGERKVMNALHQLHQHNAPLVWQGSILSMGRHMTYSNENESSNRCANGRY